MALKTINFNVFKLSAINEDLEIIDFNEILTKTLPAYSDVLQNGSPINIVEIKTVNKFVFGTLTHIQMNDLSPVVDSLTKKVIGELPIAPTQGLGHFTSFLFDKELQMIVYESKQNGVSLNSFCNFFERNYALPPIGSEFVLDPAELNKLDKMKVIRKFAVKIARVENGSIFNSNKASFKQVIHSADNTNTNVLEYAITADRGDSLTLNKVKQMVRDLFRYKETEEVEKLEISGKESEEQAAETINFVTNRVRVSIQVERKRFSQSFALKEKYEMVEEVYKKIRPQLLIAYKMKKVKN